MTQFPHDQFAKEFLSELLSPLGTVEKAKDVPAQVREIDVFFQPNAANSEYVKTLGLLGKMAGTVALIEPFRNAVNPEEIFSCVLKLLDKRGETLRKAFRDQQRSESTQLPFLWILTPTASENLLNSFGFVRPVESQNWEKGVYFLPDAWRVALVAIHQLPKVSDTLWLRVLGKGRVQQEAIAELTALPVDNPLRESALELLYALQANLQANLASNTEVSQEDRELVMAIAPLFQEQLQAAQQQGIQLGLQQGIQQGKKEGIQEGIQQGLQQGIQQGKQEGREEGIQEGLEQGIERGRQEQQRLIFENFWSVRFGELDEKVAAFIPAVSTLPAAEFTVMLLSVSMLNVGAEGRQQAHRLLAENLLAGRSNELGERLPVIVAKVVELPAERLRTLLEQLPQLSGDELINLLSDDSGVLADSLGENPPDFSGVENENRQGD
ncbi:MAG: flagellar assembly protein H [Oscillatoriaceae cyanobacterium Prado104]|nr:flagellar assembly protein H [Oscillatoriaceae cyanobacterium Prado104]